MSIAKIMAAIGVTIVTVVTGTVLINNNNVKKVDSTIAGDSKVLVE